MHFAPSMAVGMLADLNGLVVVAIFVALSILSSVLQKLQKKRNQSEGQWPKQDTPQDEWDWPGTSSSASGTRARTSSPASNWEEELKRLLGEAPAEPPPPPPVVVATPPPRPVPAPPPVVIVSQPMPRPTPPVMRQPERPRAKIPMESRELVVTPPHLEPANMGKLSESEAAYALAQKMEEAVANRVADVTQRPVKLTRAIRHNGASADAVAAVAMFRWPATARQAFIASQIFGPPRALETSPW